MHSRNPLLANDVTFRETTSREYFMEKQRRSPRKIALKSVLDCAPLKGRRVREGEWREKKRGEEKKKKKSQKLSIPVRVSRVESVAATTIQPL